jgi:hypothetical protein
VANISSPSLLAGTDLNNDVPLFGFNIIHCKKNPEVRRGAIIKSICILSKYGELIGSSPFACGLSPILRKALLEFFPERVEDFPTRDRILAIMRSLYNSVNQSVDLSRYSSATDLLPNLKYSTIPLIQVFF